MPRKQTPTAVRVARWTAIAAAVTALGSTVNTMWEKKPWFLGGEEVAKVEHVEPMAGVRPMIAYSVDSNRSMYAEQEKAIVESLVQSGMSRPAAEVKAKEIMELQSQPVMASGPEPSLFARAYYFKERHPIYFWLIVACFTLVGGSVLVEYIHRRNEKKAEQDNFSDDFDKDSIP